MWALAWLRSPFSVTNSLGHCGQLNILKSPLWTLAWFFSPFSEKNFLSHSMQANCRVVMVCVISEWALNMCTLWAREFSKSLPHLLHEYTCCLCVARWSRCSSRVFEMMPHTVHFLLYWLKCILRRCRFTEDFSVKNLPQSLQSKGFSPLCMRMWLARWPVWVNRFPHSSHLIQTATRVSNHNTGNNIEMRWDYPIIIHKLQEAPPCEETRFSTIQPSIDVTGIRNERWQWRKNDAIDIMCR